MFTKIFAPLLRIPFISGLLHADWQLFKKKPKLTLENIAKLQGFDNIVPYSDCLFSKEENVAIAIKDKKRFLVDGNTGKVMHDEEHYEFENQAKF